MKLLLTMLIALSLAACQKARIEPFDPFHVAKIEPPVDARAPLTGGFRDQTGRAVTLSALANGLPIVLAPVQYLCPSLCGLTLSGLDQAAQRQPDRDFTLVALGIDPHEGPRQAAQATARLSAPIHALTGPEAASRALAQALGYRYAWDARMGQYAHLSAVAVLAPDGHLIRWLPGPQVSPANLAQTLEQARGAPPRPIVQRLFLLCYHLIDRGGRYDHRIVQWLRFAGGATVMLLLIGIGGLIARGRQGVRP